MSSLLVSDRSSIEWELDKMLDKSPASRVLGIYASTRRPLPEFIERHGVTFRLAWCASELEVREQLDGAGTGGSIGLIVVTPLDPITLGCDIIARLPRGRLLQPDRWAALRDAFKARDVDPRLRTQRWLVDLLLSHSPSEGYPPATGDVLDLETAWRAVLSAILGMADARADAAGLLAWTLDGRGLDRFALLPEEARTAIVARLADSPAAALVLGAVAAGRGTEAMALGLACGVVFGEDVPRPALRDAAVRLEPLAGGMSLDRKAGMSLADAAAGVLKRLNDTDQAASRHVQSQAVLLLSDIRALDAVALSPALDAGLDARMVEAARALTAAMTTGNRDDAEHAGSLVRHAEDHGRAGEHCARLDRLAMAARLARWLAIPPPAPPLGMTEAAHLYAGDGGYADLARHRLRHGDDLPEVASAYAGLRERALARREQGSRAFAAVLRDWIAAGGPGTDPLPVEKVLDGIVAPLASHGPVLLLVLDGLSFAVWREITDTVARLGWDDLRPTDGRASPIAVAVLPSLTEVSRASLLGGALGRGGQAHERAHFGAHPGLVRAAPRNSKPPRLFHKADLGSGPELDPALRDALADPAQRVVGVVHNAVDAQLSGSDQIDLPWSAESLRQVTAILRVARDARRVLVVTGDHGHVVDEGTTQAAPGAGGRWREAGPAGEGEIALSGSRVLPPNGGHSLVATWSEQVRNGAPRGGYHGGASPQEVLVPVAVLCVRDVGAPPGWTEASPADPLWWHGGIGVVPLQAALPISAPSSGVPARLRHRPDGARQPELFAEAGPPRPSSAAAPSGGIEDLFGSAAYAAQRRLAGRSAPLDDQIRPLLLALTAHGGRLSQIRLAQAMSKPLVRVPGLVNAARRVLNLDQAQVLQFDGEDVVLDEAMLRTQFELGA